MADPGSVPSEELKTSPMPPDGNEENPTPIQKFFARANIFLTGGTGFIGMLLLEKLLVSCPQISKIYMLVRTKKGKDVQSRLDEIFDNIVFSRLKEQCPDFRKKIVLVEGDCEMQSLGIDAHQRALLIREVDVIFHVAATVRFDEKLKKASFTNVRALRDLLRLAHQMPNLISFLHVSTVYSNYIHKIIKEEIYPPAMDYRKLLNLTESLSDEALEEITPKLLDGYPNTYTYTKQIGEDLVRQEGKGLPIGINRPAIGLNTYKEPLRGWINNVFNAAGLSTGVAMGLIRAVEIKSSVKPNIVPGDMCVNSIIASAWDVGQSFAENKHQHDIPVYNFDGDQAPPMTFHKVGGITIKYYHRIPLSKSLWYPIWFYIHSHRLYVIAAFFLHTVPGFFVDAILICKGKKSKMMNIYRKLHKFIALFSFFSKSNWDFESKTMRSLIDKMSADDQRIFYCDLKYLDWEEYFENYVAGIRIYIFKEPTDTVPQAKQRYKRIRETLATALDDLHTAHASDARTNPSCPNNL